MARIAVIGGTGYAGRHIVEEAARRGHTVLSVARKVPGERVPGVTYAELSLLDAPTLAHELDGVDVVISAVSPREDMAGQVRPNLAALIELLPETVRIGAIGGAGGSRVSPGGPLLIDSGFPDEYRAEAAEAIGVLEDLRAGDSDVDWFFVHPAGGFGAWEPGERTGHYRTGGDVLVVDDDGRSFISGADLAVAVVDEIEEPAHIRQNFTVGY